MALASGGTPERGSSTHEPGFTRPAAGPLLGAAGQDPAKLARGIAAAALDIATDAHRARDYATAISAACIAVDSIAAIAQAQRARPG